MQPIRVLRVLKAWVLLRRSLALPLLVALPPLLWVIDATHRASLTTLGRDQGIFQYVAWAVRNGAVDYRDVRDVNGPLTHLVHMVMLAFGGADEHRFRTIDLTVTGLTFAFAGACLPGVVGKRGPSWLARAGWAFAAWVILSGQYLMYLYWDLAQRESFFDWFMVTGAALQLYAQRDAARRPWLFGVAGALLAIPWFGKPTYVLFSAGQALTLLLDRELGIGRRRALALFVAGSAAGAASQLGFLAIYGDLGAFFRIYFADVPAMYRFMMPRSSAEILSLQWGGKTAALAIATSLTHVGLVLDGQLPRRTLSFAFIPLAGLLGVLAQAKGFPYHFHPVTVGLHLEWLLLVVWSWERFRRAPRQNFFTRLVPYAAGAMLTTTIATRLTQSPHVQNVWILGKASTAEERASRDYLIYFRNSDFFPWEMRQAAGYLRAHTKPDDRVQIYGMDPYLLFLAERMSATPYIYVYDLNADAALFGSWMPTGLRPNGEQSAVIKAMRDAHEQDFLRRLKEAPPAAFVFFDKSPLISQPDAVADFTDRCAESAAWVRANYRERAVFGEDRIWMRNDLDTPEVGLPSPSMSSSSDRHEAETFAPR